MNKKYLKKRIIRIFFTILISIILVTISLSHILANDSKDNCNEESDCKVIYRNDILPYPFSRGSAVWVEDSIYIFGGRNETDMLDSIMKYTPRIDKLEILDTKLPTVLMGTTSVYDGKYVHIFGGKDYDDFYDSILRFDPVTETIINMTARLPNPTVGGAAVWTGEYIYFFGGSWGGILPMKFDSILRYDTARDNITLMNSTLTYGRSGLAATWDGEFIYVIGGSDGKKYSAEVFKYSPINDSLTLMPGKLPTGRTHIQAEYYNGSIYIFGGRGSPTLLYDQILKYDLKTDKVEILSQELPRPSEFRMHSSDGDFIYIIGGFNGPNQFNQFIRFSTQVCVCTGTCSDDEGIYSAEDLLFYYSLIIAGLLFIIGVIVAYNRKKKE